MPKENSNARNHLQAVIFDVDGTLAETERDGHRVAFNQAFAEFGMNWHWTPDEYATLLGIAGGKERMRHYAARCAPHLLPQRGFSDQVARVYRRKSEIYSHIALGGSIPLRPGIRRLMTELRAAGIRLAIATTTAHASLNSLIVANFGCPMESLFEVIGAGDQVPNKKPAPDIYAWVLKRLGLTATACLAVEDTHIGLYAARCAGLQTIVTPSEYSAGENFSGALTVVASLGEPDAPARHIAGATLSQTHVNLEQVQNWHATAAMC